MSESNENGNGNGLRSIIKTVLWTTGVLLTLFTGANIMLADKVLGLIDSKFDGIDNKLETMDKKLDARQATETEILQRLTAAETTIGIHHLSSKRSSELEP